VQRQPNLPEIVAALAAAGRLARRLHRRQQQCNEDSDDRDYNQQLDKGETAPAASGFGSGTHC
jgi:hypothetical protein